MRFDSLLGKSKQIKKTSTMKSILAICSLLLVSISATPFNKLEDPDSLKLKCTETDYAFCLLASSEENEEVPVQIDDIQLYQVEEEVTINFDTRPYLPEGFNPFKGIGDLNWDTIQLFEVEEEVILGFDTKQYLPKGFNPFKGIGDLNWDDIQLFEMNEEFDLGFDTKPYLPDYFNPYKGLGDLDWSKIELYEIEEEVIINFDTKKYLPANFDPYNGLKV